VDTTVDTTPKLANPADAAPAIPADAAPAIPALLDPEQQFVGCLMWLPLDNARLVLAGMRATDLADPTAAAVLQLAIELVAADRPPVPVTLYAHATTTGRVTGEHHRARLGRWLTDTYTATRPVPGLPEHLKIVVLETAWRRALHRHATRVLHATDSSSTDVVHELADDTSHADDLWTRYRTATDHHTTASVVAA
jgi:hypothetical protein